MSLSNFVGRVRNIVRNDADINGDTQRIGQVAWTLFLKVYDEEENDWELDDDDYKSIIPEKCRWRNRARDDGNGNALAGDDLLSFASSTLFIRPKNIETTLNTPVRGTIVKTTSGDANQYMKDGAQLCRMLNVIDGLNFDGYKGSHVFGEIYEIILKEMQPAGSSGEFYTPRALTEFIAEIVNPQTGEKMVNFACSTGGFITNWLGELDRKVRIAEDREEYNQSVLGTERKQFPYMLCATNLLLHGADTPLVFHDNSLTKDIFNYTDEDKFDAVLMSPPYGDNEKFDVKSHFPSDMRNSEIANLFMVLIMYRLKKNGRAAVIVPDSFLSGTGSAKIAIKTKLFRDFSLHTIIHLPGSIFAPYASIATNILFFSNTYADDTPEGFSTKDTWFYRLDMPEDYKHFSKTKSMKFVRCNPTREWWSDRKEMIVADDDERARCYPVQELIDTNCNSNLCKFPKGDEEISPPAELLANYFKKRKILDHEIDETLAKIQHASGIDVNIEEL